MDHYLEQLYTNLVSARFDQFVRDNYLDLDLYLDGYLQQLMNGEGGWGRYGMTARARVLHALNNLRNTGSIY